MSERIMKEKFNVGGMTCSACSSGIERNVSKIDGVCSVSVSLMGKSMDVEFDAEKVSDEKIISVVEKLGYTASVYGREIQEKNYALVLKKRFFFSLGLLVALMYFSMGAMIGLPVPAKNINLPVQAALALVIMIINGRFFTAGTKAVIHGAPNMDTLVAMGSLSAYLYSAVLTVMFFAGASDPMNVF